MQLSIREPGSAITHFTAMLLAAGSSIPLLIKSATKGPQYLVAMSIFIVSMILLYGASATYHSVTSSPEKIKKLKKVDHMMIFVLIAGSYTPICMVVLDHKWGYPLLIIVWSIALLGIVIKALWIYCPKWFSSVLYIAMGWLCLLVFGPIVKTLPLSAFLWLLIGGILYTVGGVIYALKLEIFNNKHKYFGSHEIFHVFIMAGSFCHFIFMYQYVIGL